ncbi:MAG: flagellar motor switch protein FliG [Brockia lithotrophica]|nr:flagellar motor switch protein FliG [Brockia lithotrophica]
MPRSTKELTGKEKAAVLLIGLGPEVSAKVLRHLTDEEIEELTLEIAATRHVPSELRNQIIKEFHELVLAQTYIAEGGISYAREVLEKALGRDKAMDILKRLTSMLQVRPFDFLKQTDSMQLLHYLQEEHPQTIALVLSYLEPKQAAEILASLPPERQGDIAFRMATMRGASPEAIYEVERILEQKLASTGIADITQVGGVDAVVQILNLVDRSTERAILEQLETTDPELAEEIKKRMFVFEDIVLLDNRSIQKVIREVPQEDLVLALKGASEEVRQLLFRNMSQRMAESIREEMEYMGPVRLRDVEEAQGRIVGVIRRLEELGEIYVRRGGEDDLIE